MDAVVVVVALALYPVAILTMMKLYVAGCAAAGVLCVGSYAQSGRAPVATLRSAWPVYAFWALIPASAFWSIARPDTLRASLTASASFVVFHLSLGLFRRQGPLWLSRVVLVTPHVWACVIGGILLRYGAVRATAHAMGDVVGSSANVGPAVTELTVPYLLCIVATQRHKRSWAIAALGSALFVVFASQSRGALLMLVATLALVALLFGRTLVAKTRRLVAMGVAVGVVAALLFMTLGADYLRGPLDRLTRSQILTSVVTEEVTVDEGDYLRTVMYLEGIAAIRADPWRGLGYNALGSIVEKAHGVRLVSHNIILTAWGELGAVGLALAVAIAAVGTRRIWRARARARRVDPRAFYWHTATLIAWIIALGHAQGRPQLNNPMFHVVVAAAFAAGSMRSFGSPNARHPG